ncbi:hypothetical protein [uncultured Jatrophihabitans sp.]|uniref:hypothetical protein n=1 Tax=uncultured Jatrophihabitans sp. TaxID=1610747 RepID=UPI0035CB637B
MAWIAIGAWIAAAVVAVVVLGVGVYEIGWKTKRLRGDLRQLQGLTGELDALLGQLARVQQRLAAAASAGKG